MSFTKNCFCSILKNGSDLCRGSEISINVVYWQLWRGSNSFTTTPQVLRNEFLDVASCSDYIGVSLSEFSRNSLVLWSPYDGCVATMVLSPSPDPFIVNDRAIFQRNVNKKR